MRYINQFMGFMLKTCYDLVSTIIPGDSNLISNYAIAIILLSIFIKLITLPLTIKSSRAMAKTRELQPKLKEIQEKYGNDAQTIARKQQELYKETGVSPLGGCLPTLIQLPVLFAMYNVVRSPEIYAFTEPGVYEAMNKAFLWLSNLNNVDTTMIMAISAAVISFLNTKLMTASQPPAAGSKEQQEAMEASNRTMQFMMPAMLFFIYRNLPAVIPFYMIISMGLSTLQQVLINKSMAKGSESTR